MKYVKTFEQYSAHNEEFFGSLFAKKPLTDDEINKYLMSHPARRMLLKNVKSDEAKKEALMNFLRENPEYVKDDLVLQNLNYENGKFVVSRAGSSGNWN